MSSDMIWFIKLEKLTIIFGVLPENFVFQPFTFLLLRITIKPLETVTKPKKGLEQGKPHSSSNYCKY
jgi:hypothetical protein